MKHRSWKTVVYTVLAVCALTLNISAGVKDTPFVQEYHEGYPLPGAPDLRAIAVDKNDRVWVATDSGLYGLLDGAWELNRSVEPGPLYDLSIDEDGSVWVGAWNGLYRVDGDGAEKITGVEGPVAVVGNAPGGSIALGPDGSWRKQDESWKAIESHWSLNVRDSVLDSNGALWIATGLGLYRWDQGGVRHFYLEDNLYSTDLNALAIAPDGRLWIGELGGIDVFENGAFVQHFSGTGGLPNYDVRALTFAPDGTLWAGTALGVARFDGRQWSIRHSRRWLLSDDVRDVAFDGEGTAWIATGAGVSAIKRRTMTLAQKADYYYDVLLKRHVRAPWIVEKCFFPDPKDRTRFEPRDDDNDGQYTSMYLVMESMRYAVTKDPVARENADKAYDFLEFLQTVTGTDGFVARTVVPSDWKTMADSNEEISPRMAAERRAREPRYKPVEQRWRASADGKWLWKGDTSSDEITGHFSGYLFYYDLAADDGRKERVRRLVRRITDYIIEGGYVLRDIDGKSTRWGVWAPEKLNGDPDWRSERPINSFEILSYLKTTYHITGDEKYQREYLKLINDRGYAENCRRPKNYGRSERTYIDDELLALAMPGLMLYEDDPALRSIYMEGLTWAYRTIENDWNPYFDFTFGLIGGQNFHLDQSVAFLRDHSLDLIQWTVDNSQREDLKLVRFPMLEPLQIDRMLPPSERGVMRWDKNPWTAVSGDFCDQQGHLESCGVFWLLPYWMGRYGGFIEAPE